jgi:nicotinate phosphoribosyltransferase
MAHSFVQAHDDESQAFAHFVEVYPRSSTLLIDTYDTEEGARKVVALAKGPAGRDARIGSVRLDSGDLDRLSRSVREILSAGGLRETTVFASGNLDEYRVAQLLAAGAPVDGFGIGTSLDTSSDAPSLDMVYKLQEYAGKPRRKRSTAKATWPGRKQVFRHYESGRMHHDVVALEDDDGETGEALLAPVMARGRRVAAPEALDRIRERTARGLAALPARLRSLDPATEAYDVRIAPAVRKLADELDQSQR